MAALPGVTFVRMAATTKMEKCQRLWTLLNHLFKLHFSCVTVITFLQFLLRNFISAACMYFNTLQAAHCHSGEDRIGWRLSHQTELTLNSHEQLDMYWNTWKLQMKNTFNFVIEKAILPQNR